MTSNDPQLVDRATRLFTYLSRVAALQHKPVRNVDAYARDGAVKWLSSFPDHTAVRWGEALPDTGDDLLISVARVRRAVVPELPQLLEGWITAPRDNPNREPVLLESFESEDGQLHEQLPEHASAFQQWLAKWRVWAEKDRADAPVRQLYADLYASHVQAQGNPEEMEFVLGVGLVSWQPDDENRTAFRRHAFSVPVSAEVDPRTGQIALSIDDVATGLTAELDFLDSTLVPLTGTKEEVEIEARGFADSPLDEPSFAVLAAALVNRLSADGQYEPNLAPGDPQPRLVVSWSPALILRKRSVANLAQAFEKIAGQIEQAQSIPAGLLPLVAPGQGAVVRPETTPGAIVPVGEDLVTPLPLNTRQREILRRVNDQPQTLVQGPPGTGKTHTAAALLSHLLAQGKRVLVTAHTDRALAEVRAKLPDPVKPLAVSVLGTSRAEMNELKLSVETINQRAGELSETESERQVVNLLNEMHHLGKKRTRLHEQLLALRESESAPMGLPSYPGTPVQTARALRDQAPRFAWIAPLIDPKRAPSCPLNSAEVAEWWQLTRRGVPAKASARASLPGLESFASPAHAASAFTDSLTAERTLEGLAHWSEHPHYQAVSRFTSDQDEAARRTLLGVEGLIEAVNTAPTDWERQCRADVVLGNTSGWLSLGSRLAVLAGQAEEEAAKNPSNLRVEVMMPAGEALALATYLKAQWPNHPLKTDATGMPRIGLLGPRAVKESMAFFHNTRVNDLPPRSLEDVDQIVTHIRVHRLIDEMDECWSRWGLGTHGQSTRARLDAHRARYEELVQTLRMETRVTQHREELNRLGLSLPRLTPPAVSELANVLKAHDERQRMMVARQAWEDECHRLELMASRRGGDVATRLYTTYLSRSSDDYASAYADLEAAHANAAQQERRATLEQTLSNAAPMLVRAMLAPSEIDWDTRALDLTAAWDWAGAQAGLSAGTKGSATYVQEQINDLDAELEDLASQVAATRAWAHAVGEERLGQSERADLMHYVQLVRSLGKGTGKYASRKRAEVRRAMDNCRGSVPVWIMPIYRVVEQFDIRENMFDVVLVDEASQAGISAVFLQYLAPRIVVIGDEKQVSPMAVGVDQEQLRRLAAEFLYDDRYISSWQNPQRSLFDEAKMRYGHPITLVEHRRCMPEIIGFSNEIAYAPEGNALIPVRQYGADRLPPIRIIHTPDGETTGTTKKSNAAEARAIVDQIKECLEDPRYDGRTFGVISLVGAEQARVIESLLLEEVDSTEIEERQIRCGDATAFQGSERDVIFLSMVSAVSNDTRLAAMTREDALQRFNVASSRAKDQLWLVHSVTAQQLPNAEDMRRRLLEYCYGQVAQAPEAQPEIPTKVREDRRVAPFASVFQQRVFNVLCDRGYRTDVNVDASGVRLDLVVIGRCGRMAIQCDGETWSGRAAYGEQLAKERDLVRCGWPILHLRESQFEISPDDALGPLWSKLDELDIRPAAEQSRPQQEDDAVIVIRSEVEHNAHPVFEEIESPVSVRDLGHGHVREDDQDEEPARPTRAIVEPEPEPAPATTPVIGAYRSFRGELGPAQDLEDYEVAGGLVEIVRVEGPIVGSRLFHQYIRSSGGGPLDRETRNLLAQGIAHAVRQGQLISVNPDGKQDMSGRVYRLADQSTRIARQLGPRDVSEVPADELTALMEMTRRDGASEDEWLDEATRALGLGVPSPRLLEALTAALSRAQSAQEAQD